MATLKQFTPLRTLSRSLCGGTRETRETELWMLRQEARCARASVPGEVPWRRVRSAQRAVGFDSVENPVAFLALSQDATSQIGGEGGTAVAADGARMNQSRVAGDSM